MSYSTWIFSGATTGLPSIADTDPLHWYRAEDNDSVTEDELGYVSMWQDRARGSNHFLQNVGTKCPRRISSQYFDGKKVLSFDGGDDFMVQAFQADEVFEISLLLAWRPKNGGTGKKFGFSLNTWHRIWSDTSLGFGYTYNPNANLSYKYKDGFSASAHLVLQTSNALNGIATGQCYYEAQDVGNTGTTYMLAGQPAYIGADAGGLSGFALCEIAELVVWDRMLKVHEMLGAAQELNTLYGLPEWKNT